MPADCQLTVSLYFGSSGSFLGLPRFFWDLPDVGDFPDWSFSPFSARCLCFGLSLALRCECLRFQITSNAGRAMWATKAPPQGQTHGVRSLRKGFFVSCLLIMSGHVRPRQVTGICNLGVLSQLDFLNILQWMFSFSPAFLCNLVRQSPKRLEKVARILGGE